MRNSQEYGPWAMEQGVALNEFDWKSLRATQEDILKMLNGPKKFAMNTFKKYGKKSLNQMLYKESRSKHSNSSMF